VNITFDAELRPSDAMLLWHRSRMGGRFNDYPQYRGVSTEHHLSIDIDRSAYLYLILPISIYKLFRRCCWRQVKEAL